MLLDGIRFFAKYTHMRIIEAINNKIVMEHFLRTPDKATEDTLREIILENIRYVQRKLDQKGHSLWVEMLEIAGRSFPEGWQPTEEEVAKLKEERRYKDESDFGKLIAIDDTALEVINEPDRTIDF